MYVVQLSHKLFQGFTFKIPYETEHLDLQSQNNLINETCKMLLLDYFNSKNLVVLMDEVKNLKVHLHQRLKRNEDNWACDHCHN